MVAQCATLAGGEAKSMLVDVHLRHERGYFIMYSYTEEGVGACQNKVATQIVRASNCET